jgi:hypothetical protein
MFGSSKSDLRKADYIALVIPRREAPRQQRDMTVAMGLRKFQLLANTIVLQHPSMLWR